MKLTHTHTHTCTYTHTHTHTHIYISFLCFYVFFVFFFLLTVQYVFRVFYGPLWTDFSINGLDWIGLDTHTHTPTHTHTHTHTHTPTHTYTYTCHRHWPCIHCSTTILCQTRVGARRTRITAATHFLSPAVLYPNRVTEPKCIFTLARSPAESFHKKWSWLLR